MSTKVVTDDNQIYAALRKARNEISPVEKGKENPFFQSNYMDLDAIKAAVDPVLEANGLYITQWPDTTESGEPALTTVLVHESGDTMQATAALSLSKKDPQAQGSAITYMKRYAYVSILGIKGVDPDDDGNTATMSDKTVTRSGGKADASNASSEVVRLRGELTAAAKAAGMSSAQLTKAYHDEFGKDYKSDTDEGNLAAALVKVGMKK